VPRKGIELAIDLLAELSDARNILVITHRAGDEGLDYLGKLERYAGDRGVDLRYVGDRVDHVRTVGDRKVYSLWDAYPHADFVTYPSLYEGFGNALVETVYFRLPALVNRYSVYVADIAPLGFEFVEIDSKVTPGEIRAVARLLEEPEARRHMTEVNYRLGARHFSYSTLLEILSRELSELGFEW
jgi:glycosyltransferase involved in cell wall biosynthesis